MNLGWHFEKIGEMGGAHAGAFRNPLAGSGLQAEHKLARECIQNSVDAQRGDEVVKVRFRIDDAGDKRLEDIGNAIHLLDKGGPAERSFDVPDFGITKGDFFEAQLDATGRQEHLLFVEDWGTHGLGGPSTSTATDSIESRYYRLVLGFGVADDSDLSRGGSFGFGKSVYWESSDVNTVAFYSVFNPGSAPDGEHARLILAGVYQTHEFNGTTYTGRAWFGDRKSEGYCAPLVDAAAHEMAERLGFTPRGESDLGTSVMVMGCNLDLSRIREGIENHWWPRIADGNLVAELMRNGDFADPPAPSSRAHLATYIKAYRLAKRKERVESDSAEVRRASASTPDKHQVGWTAVVPADKGMFPPEGERDHNLKPMFPDINEVALIRTPRMVVTYHEIPGASQEAEVVGVFIGDDEIDPILKRSEPPDHTRWAKDSGRLRSDTEKRLVGGITSRVNRAARALQRRLAGPVDEAPGRPRALEEMLGRLFGSTGGGSHPPPPPDPSPFSVSQPVCEIEVSREGHRVSGHTEITYRPADGDDALCRITVRAYLADDDNHKEGEPVAVVLDGGHDPPADDANGSTGRVVWTMRKQETRRVNFKTDWFPDYATCGVVVEALEV